MRPNLIEPQLGGLQWIDGKVPTPDGDVSVYCSADEHRAASALAPRQSGYKIDQPAYVFHLRCFKLCRNNRQDGKSPSKQSSGYHGSQQRDWQKHSD
ncbi:hypothetical protein [Spirosoma gilvum]